MHEVPGLKSAPHMCCRPKLPLKWLLGPEPRPCGRQHHNTHLAVECLHQQLQPSGLWGSRFSLERCQRSDTFWGPLSPAALAISPPNAGCPFPTCSSPNWTDQPYVPCASVKPQCCSTPWAETAGQKQALSLQVQGEGHGPQIQDYLGDL